MENHRQRHRVLSRTLTLILLTVAIGTIAQPASALNTTAFRKWPWVAGQVRRVTTPPGVCPHCPGRESSSAWKAIDIGDMDFETIYSVSPGTVDFYAANSSGGAGHYLRIKEAGSSSYITYEHLERSFVSAGQVVYAGQPIGKSGCTGNCHGAHLHFQRQDGTKFSSNALDLTPISGVTSVSSKSYTSDNAGIGYSSNGGLLQAVRTAYDAAGGYNTMGSTANHGDQWTPCQDDSIKGTWWRFSCNPKTGVAGYVQTFLTPAGKRRAILVEKGYSTGYVVLPGILGAYTSKYNLHDWVYWLGYPTSNRYAISGGYRQDFRGGYITNVPANCAENIAYQGKISSYTYCD